MFMMFILLLSDMCRTGLGLQPPAALLSRNEHGHVAASHHSPADIQTCRVQIRRGSLHC